MKKTILSLMVFGGLFMASCSDGIYDEPRNEGYTKSFIELFGQIDENQDWNMAEQKSVTVTGATSNVKIYAKNGDHYSLVGDYKNVNDGQTLKFDAAKGVDEFVVASNGAAAFVKNGETANLAITVGKRDITENGYTEFTYDEVMAYANRLPEETNNYNVSGISTDFTIVSDGEPMTVWPVFWNASYGHMFGVFWYENGEMQTKDLYQTKQGDGVQILINDQWINSTEKNSTNTGKDGISGETAEAIRSRGYVIQFNEGVHYGFYIKVLPSNYMGFISAIYYSLADLNTQDNGYSHAAYFETELEDGTNRYFIGFEDQPYNSGDKDLNDLMVILDHKPELIDETEHEWILAAEDLGSTDDYDYNDVVFSVSYVSGREYATVTPRAAGGILPAYICHGGEEWGEIHEMLGGTNTSTMINTQSAGAAGQPIEIPVPADFTMSYINDTNNMGGFSIRVVGNDKPIVAPGQGDAPMMFCVPAGWQWPTERTPINEAYPEFGAYASNADKSTWYLAPEADKVLGNSSK